MTIHHAYGDGNQRGADANDLIVLLRRRARRLRVCRADRNKRRDQSEAKTRNSSAYHAGFGRTRWLELDNSICRMIQMNVMLQVNSPR